MLKLEIVTPERKVVDLEVDLVTVPTANGEAGILPNHAPLISAVKPGVVSYSVKNQTERIAVSSGFVEVSGGNVALLVDSAELADEIDIAAAKTDRDEAEKALAASSANALDENAELLESVEHAAARVSVAGSRQ